MPKQVLNRWMPTSAAELRDAIAEILTDIACEGADLETVYVEMRDIVLVRDTLTDGSTVMNIEVRENLPSVAAPSAGAKAAALITKLAAPRPGYDTYVDDFDYAAELGSIIEEARALL